MATSRRKQKVAVVRRRSDREDDGAELRGTIIQVERADGDTSRLIDYLDEFQALALMQDTIIPTPYSVSWLREKVESSSLIPQCIDAYVTNTVGTGWEVDPSNRNEEADAEESCILGSFITNANVEQSLRTVLSDVVREREEVGFSFLEVIRSVDKSVSLFRHAPALTIRMTPKHTQEVMVDKTITRGQRTFQIKEFKRFRRYMQVIQGEIVYFKEFGDPRNLCRTTGAFEGEPLYIPGNLATELIHMKVPGANLYGIPRWVANLPNVLGTRSAEEVNYKYFRDNTVPPMMLTVSGGRLTSQSYRNLTKMLNNEGIGSNRQHRIMLVEAVGDGDSLDGRGSTVNLKVEKLTDARQNDAVFENYERTSSDKIRSSWRLPSIVLGNSKDANYANAQVSLQVAEGQVFGPERDRMDDFLNRTLVSPHSGLGLSSVVLKGRVPSINSPESVIKTLTALNVIGAVTPRSAQTLANQMLQTELAQYPRKDQEGYKEWMDTPVSIFLRSQSTTHDEQSVKDSSIKEIEETGDPGFKRPENGSEGDVL